MIRIIDKTIIYLSLIFLFLQGSGILVGNMIIRMFYFILMVSLLYFVIKDNFIFFKSIKKIIIKTPLKYLFIFLLFYLVISFVLCIFHQSTWGNLLKGFLLHYIFGIIPICLFFSYIIFHKYITIFNITKIFIFLFWLNTILSIIVLIADIFNFDFLTNIINFICNIRNFNDGIDINPYSTRLKGFFEEPGFYAGFIYIFLPFTYFLTSSKVKLYKNKFINLILKKTFVPLVWINIILTKSPIFLLLCGLLTIICYYKELKKFFIKHSVISIIILLTTLFIMMLGLNFLKASESYLSRIGSVFQSKNIIDLIMLEPSLATRIVCYIYSIKIGLSHLLTGVGIKSIDIHLLNSYYSGLLPLTPEIITHIDKYKAGLENIFYVNAIAYYLFAESGIIGVYLYFKFYINMLSSLNKIKNNIPKLSFDYVFLKSSFFTIIGLLIYFFYDSRFIQQEIYFISTLISMYIYMLNNKKYGRE